VQEEEEEDDEDDDEDLNWIGSFLTVSDEEEGGDGKEGRGGDNC
jgi:hypothetical protein